MRTTKHSKTIASALEELGAELGISEADFGGRLKIEGKYPVAASKHHLGESRAGLPPQAAFSEFKLGPRFSGEPNGASKLDWSVFTREGPT